MTQKERLKAKQRLIELFETSPSIVGSATWREYYEQTADHFLDNGVIVPPCKVGDTVYAIAPDCEYQYVADCDASCTFCEHRRSKIETWTVKSLYQVITVLQSWGTRCFSTYEAAEQALKERETT